MSQHHQARWGLFQICLAGVLWGTGGLGVQLIRQREDMSVLTISAWRMLLAAVVLAVAVMLLRQTPAVVALVSARPVRAALVGAGTASYQALYFGAVVAAGVTVATVVSLGLAPVLLTVVESVRQRRRPSRTRLLVLAGALSGLLLVSLTSGSGETCAAPGARVCCARFRHGIRRRDRASAARSRSSLVPLRPPRPRPRGVRWCGVPLGLAGPPATTSW